MIIDIHNHPYWYHYNTEKYLENMDNEGIDKTCLLTWESPLDEYDPAYNKVLPDVGMPDGPVSFRSCLKMKESAPERFILGYCPDPRTPDAADKLIFAVKTYGVRICGELKLRMMYDNYDAIRLYKACGELGIPVLVHLDDPLPDSEVKYPRPDYWYGGGIDALERAAKKCPDTVFIGHAPGFWGHISKIEGEYVKPYESTPVIEGGKLPLLLDKCPNVYCDISAGSGRVALSRDPEFTKKFLTKYSDRVLYGRDWFDHGHRELLDNLGLDKEVLERIYHKNAEKLLGL